MKITTKREGRPQTPMRQNEGGGESVEGVFYLLRAFFYLLTRRDKPTLRLIRLLVLYGFLTYTVRRLLYFGLWEAQYRLIPAYQNVNVGKLQVGAAVLRRITRMQVTILLAPLIKPVLKTWREGVREYVEQREGLELMGLDLKQKEPLRVLSREKREEAKERGVRGAEWLVAACEYMVIKGWYGMVMSGVWNRVGIFLLAVPLGFLPYNLGCVAMAWLQATVQAKHTAKFAAETEESWDELTRLKWAAEHWRELRISCFLIKSFETLTDAHLLATFAPIVLHLTGLLWTASWRTSHAAWRVDLHQIRFFVKGATANDPRKQGENSLNDTNAVKRTEKTTIVA